MTLRARRALLSLALAAAAVLTQAGCGGSSPPPPPAVAAPADLAYPVNPAVYHRGTAIAANVPHSTGGAATGYSVSPALPAGLALDPATGVLAGTPTAIAAQASYTVTASNAGGSSACTLVITVTDAAPAGLAYGMPKGTYTKGVAIAPNAPSSSGGAVAGYSVSPALPAGLSLDPATGVISGTPSAVVARFTYTVTASNAGGSATCPLELAVVDAAPGALAYAANPATYFLNNAIPANTPSSPGTVFTTYRVAPPLPAGLLLNAATGAITGTPRAAAQGTWRVTASNSGGSATCDLALTVIAAPPANLAYAVNPVVATKGLAMAPDRPSSTGGAIAAYSVAPPLPAGLGLDPATGIVSGTPTVLAPAAAYVVTAANTGGSTTATLTLTVQDQAPAALAYATNPSSYTIATAIQPNVPTNAGGAITSYSVAPALPAGLSLDTSSGVISGTPTALSAAATYVVTGQNATGSTTCDLVTSVVGSPIAPPAAPVVTTVAYATAGAGGYHASTQDQGTADGMGYLWSVGNGSITGGQGTTAITFAAGAVGPLTVQVKATNLGGSATGSAQVSVEPVPAARLFAQEQVLYGSAGLQASVVPQAGMTYQWSLSGSAAGTLTAGASHVATYTAGAQPGSYQLSVTVQNRAGDQATASRTLSVVRDAFVADPRTAPQRQAHSTTVLADGRVLVAGGQDGVWVTATALLYDPYSGTWTPVGPMADARTRHTATLLLDGRVLVAGGEGDDYNLTPLATTELFDPATRTWTRGGDMTTVRQDHSASLLLDGTVLVSGGVPILTDTNYAFLDSAEVYDPAGDAWSAVGKLTIKRAGHTSTLLPDGRVLLAGGFSQQGSVGWQRSTDLYDPKTQAWAAGTSMPASRTGHTADLLANGKVLVAGGNGGAPANSAVLFDPAANGGAGAWSATSNTLGTGRFQHRSVVLASGKVLLVSGRDGATTSVEVASAELYDPAANAWSSGGALSSAAYDHGVARLPDGKVLAFGGTNTGSNVVHSNGQFYDPALNGWSNAPGLAHPRSSPTLTRLLDGTLLLVGGAGPRGAVAVTESFDPATGGWSAAGSLIGPRQLHQASLLPNGKVLVTGGFGTAGDLASAELYTPATRTWEAAPTMAAVRSEHTATVLADGKVLAAGGWASSTTVGASTALYDPTANGWTATPDLGAARFGHKAVLLADGKVLVTGGRNASGYLATAELFDPAARTWSPAAPMNSPRQYHTATLLADGRVLVAGGKVNASLFTATAELYDPAANTWTVAAPMSGTRGGHTATVLPDHQVLVVGGDGGPYGPALRTVERYDPAANAWTPAGSLVAPRTDHRAALLGPDGTVLVVGGDPGSTPEVWRP